MLEPIRSVVASNRYADLAWKLVRYASVGMVVFLVYNTGVWYSHTVHGASPMLASVAGYAASLPVAYLGHRRHTFKSKSRVAPELQRFMVAVAFSATMALGAMFLLVTVLGLPTMVGALTGTILVPVGNFLIYNSVVFAKTNAP